MSMNGWLYSVAYLHAEMAVAVDVLSLSRE
jgi:hypothetical protein